MHKYIQTSKIQSKGRREKNRGDREEFNKKLRQKNL